MYQALYRKWRPKTFSQVVGQDHITGTLQRQVAEGRTAHAYLFTGTRGTGKTTCARILAKAVNCLHPEDGAPCNQCEACRGIDSGSLLDVTELDAASNSRGDDIRELLSESVYTPTVLKKRVYIIDEVHMLSTQAFNALLKTIEEPPEHLMFILATTELHKVPATILSRCQRFTFKRILPRDMEKHLLEIARAEQIDLTPDGAEILARMANGALRDALSLLDQCRVAQGQLDSRAVLDILGLAGSVQTVELMDCILRRDAAGALTRLDGLYRGGKDVAAMLGELGDLARDMTILKAAPDGAAALLTGIYDTKTLKSLSGSQPMRRFLYLTETLQSCCAGLGDSFQPRTDAELCLLRLCDEGLSGDLTALSQRIDRLEDQVANGIPVKTVPQTAGTSPKTAPLSRDNAGTSRDVPSDDRPPMPEEPPLPEEPPVTSEAPPPWDEPAPAAPPQREEPPAPAREVPAAQPQPEPKPEYTADPALNKPRKVAAEGINPFPQWAEVIKLLQEQDPMLYTYLKKSKGYFDGTRVLIDGGKTFRDFIRANKESQKLIKKLIAQVSGVAVPIGPYESKTVNRASANAEESLRKLEQLGLEVSIEDSERKKR